MASRARTARSYCAVAAADPTMESSTTSKRSCSAVTPPISPNGSASRSSAQEVDTSTRSRSDQTPLTRAVTVATRRARNEAAGSAITAPRAPARTTPTMPPPAMTDR